ncbi:hypothetical protein FQN57_002086 [Myotisia sp. PD_48]|nr:hypothetical protein FQN57_002086 [Myotisia sp. PD_48]
MMSMFPVSYENLCQLIPSLTYHSSSPVAVADINPMIKMLLSAVPEAFISGIGGHSHELKMFDLLSSVPSCPFIVRPFPQGLDIIFMQLHSNRNLRDRIAIDKPRPVHRRIQQLTGAVACIESIGYVHGDLDPRNILVDNDDDLILIDFDHALEIGEDVDVGYEPYVRAHYMGEKGGSYGVAGPETELFALDSLFWYMSQGKELYEEIERPTRVNILSDRKFPAMNPDDPIDKIIDYCWHQKFLSVMELAQHIQGTIGNSEYLSPANTLSADDYLDKKKTTASYYETLLKRMSDGPIQFKRKANST